MEDQQFEKRVEWLDGERRKADEIIAQQGKRIALLEEALTSNQELANSFKREMSRLNSLSEKVSDFSKEIRANKNEVENSTASIENNSKERQKNFELRFLTDQQKTAKDIDALRKDLNQISELRTEVRANAMEEVHLSEQINKVARDMDDLNKGEEQRQKFTRSLEETRKKDDKRISEMVGEVSVAVDLSEKTFSRVEKLSEDQRRLQNKFEDLASKVDNNQKILQEKNKEMAADQVVRERIWADWEERFKTIDQQSDELATRLKDIETIELTVKRAQSSFNELIEKINRRVNELTEVQRLGEQRFRQEWSTFQADAQKRWSGFTLGQEESQKESKRQQERLSARVAQFEDGLQDLQDMSRHLSEQSDGLLQNLVQVVQDSLADGERYMNSTR
jgi:chromosome segregation ATPase